MTIESKDHYFYATIEPTRNAKIAGCIGYYSFNRLGLDDRGDVATVLLYGLWLRVDDNRVTFVPDGGEPPSARAGRALDLHQAATALIRAHADKLQTATAYYINDAGKVGSCELAEFLADRVPGFGADLPSLTHPAIGRLYQSDAAQSRPSPSP